MLGMGTNTKGGTSPVMQDQGHNNHIVLTGDLHTYMASHVKVDYGNLSAVDFENHVGAEFMTSSVTSAGLNDQLLEALKTDNRGLANGARYGIEACSGSKPAYKAIQ